MRITDLAISKIKESNRLIGRLMIAFNRGQNTIENWMASKSYMLTTHTAVQIIKEETKLTDAEILEESMDEQERAVI